MPPTLILSATDLPARVESLAGIYKPVGSGRHGTIYANSRKGLFLFAAAADDWMISTRVGSAVARARRSGALTSAEPQEWSVLARGKLKPYHIVCCESTGAVADSAPADAVRRADDGVGHRGECCAPSFGHFGSPGAAPMSIPTRPRCVHTSPAGDICATFVQRTARSAGHRPASWRHR